MDEIITPFRMTRNRRSEDDKGRVKGCQNDRMTGSPQPENYSGNNIRQTRMLAARMMKFIGRPMRMKSEKR